MSDERFQIESPFEPTGDQPRAIEELVAGIEEGRDCQTLLGATGTGKTFTMANVIARVNRPTLLVSHNKTLAAQLYLAGATKAHREPPPCRFDVIALTGPTPAEAHLEWIRNAFGAVN